MTIERYERVRDLALYGTREELEALPPNTVMNALKMRYEIPPLALQEMSASDFVPYALSYDWDRGNPDSFFTVATEVS